MSKRRDITWATGLTRVGHRSNESHCWELGRIAGIREAVRLTWAGGCDECTRDLRAHARKLKRRLK